jgi:hypothetical protein
LAMASARPSAWSMERMVQQVDSHYKHSFL